MQREVSDFIVIAPAGMGKAVEWAEPMLRSYLAGHFPLYNFRIEPYGPFADDEEFTVIPVMNRAAEPAEKASKDAVLMCHLDPEALHQIRVSLRSFSPESVRPN